MEDTPLFQAAATFCMSASLCVYVALQKPRTRLHGPVLAVLGSFQVWTAGLLLMGIGAGTPGFGLAGIWLVFGGVMVAAPLWFFLCGQVARVPIVAERPRAVLTALLVPSVLMLMALLSDPWHGLFAGGRTFEILSESPEVWAGPFFWVHTAWAYLCTGGGVWLCVRSARRTTNPIERKQLALVILAACIPSISAALTLSGAVDVALTPADLGLSSLCLVVAIVRYRFLEATAIPATAVISRLRDGLVLADPRQVVVDANPAAEALLGFGAAALRGRLLSEVARDFDPSGTLDLQPGQASGHARVSQAGRAYEVSWGPVGEGDAPPIGHFLLLRDRTEEHRQERSLNLSQRLESLGVLAAGIAHEINNPLAFVRSNLRLLRRLLELAEKRGLPLGSDELAEFEELGDVLGETEMGVERISAIVAATRKLSREPSGERRRLDLNAVARDAVQLAELHAHRGAAITLELAVDLPEVWGSADRLGQLLLNLLINAKHASGPGGLIHLVTRCEDGRVVVEVHDDGPGVPPETRDHIFDPFFTTKGPDEGTGLGLAIAHEIACQHDAVLGVGSSNLGGACFRLSLPTA